MNLIKYLSNDKNNINELLLYLYNSWNTFDKSYFSENKKNITFKLYVLNNKTLSFNIIQNCIDSLDLFFRLNFLFKKYYKKWFDYYLIKKEPINTLDLELNKIDLKKYHINYIDYVSKKRYLFTLSDFKKLVKNNLEHSYNYDMIPCPIPIKNPYTNKEFTKKELSTFNNQFDDMPIVWNMFVDCNYNISKFKRKYSSYLSEMCIPSFVGQMEDDDIIFYLKQIFLFFNINYCKKCILENSLKTKKITNIISDWILYIKYNKNFNDDYEEQLSKIYSKEKCHHRDKIYIKRSIPPFIFNLDLSKPLFSKGYYSDEEKD